MSKPKMLYICGHDVLEYNHLKLFHNIGFEVISTSKYLEPDKIDEYPLPKLHVDYNKELVSEFKSLNPKGYSYGKTKLNLSKSFIDKFDVILTSWIVEPILEYLPLLQNKVICYETLGQSNSSRENLLKQLRPRGLNVIRISEGEENFSNYAGTDAFIDLEVDTDYFSSWTGEEKYVMTVNTAFSKRGNTCKYTEYKKVISGLPAKLFGKENENIKESFFRGAASSEELAHQYRRNRVGFASISIPCPCTLTPKEMLSTGMPVVTYGPKIGGPTFRAYKYIEDGGAGFWSDDLNELKQYIQLLLENYDLAKQISTRARKTALKLFSHEVIAQKWKEFFKNKDIML